MNNDMNLSALIKDARKSAHIAAGVTQDLKNEGKWIGQIRYYRSENDEQSKQAFIVLDSNPDFESESAAMNAMQSKIDRLKAATYMPELYHSAQIRSASEKLMNDAFLHLVIEKRLASEDASRVVKVNFERCRVSTSCRVTFDELIRGVV